MEIPKELSSCVNKALYRLSMGDLTCGEMMAYLTDPKRKNTGFDPQIAERAVCFLTEQGFLDDKRYLKLCVRKLDRACVGPRKIRETLNRHRFPPRYVQAALDRQVDWTARAASLLKKKANAEVLSASPEGRKKLMDHLVRQGYDYSTARSAIGLFSQEEDFPEE